MRILLSNDDGIHAPGIQTLAKHLREFADVQVVAPDRNRSGASNSLTLESSLRTFTFENGDIAVQMGTPTDCVFLGVNALMRPRPDIVVSGINAGPNLGDDVIYSGTVAAAMEGRHLGFPALAVSLNGHTHYDTAAAVTCSILRALGREPLRTGRILNIRALVQSQLLSIPVLYLSRYIIQNKQKYYRRLQAVTEAQDWEGWLLFMLAAVEETARWTAERVLAIRSLFDATAARCRAELPSRVYSKELMELIFTQPYVRIQTMIDAGLAKRDAASDYLRELEQIGVLQSQKRGREVLYRHPALLDALTA